MPAKQSPRGQLRHRDVSELGQDIPSRHAFDAVGRLAAAAAVILEIVAHGPGDSVRPRDGGAEPGCEPLLMRPPGSSITLRLREVEDGVAVGVLEVVGKTELGFVVDATLVAPSRNPRPAGVASAIADMQSLLNHAPVRLGLRREAQPGAAGCKRSIADGTCHRKVLPILPTFCLLSVPGTSRTSTDTIAGNPHGIETS